ncbi:MAG: glycoside hydrolase family 9 protein [Oscillospiraceae bacterium]|nr:glycoside hydrolase family 9 protein [Oscillospiraceae bacterium]
MNKKTTLRRLMCAGTGALVLAASLFGIWPCTYSPDQEISAEGLEFNYAKELQYSMYMYDANMCGTEVTEKSQYTWRNDCHVYDAKLPLDSENTNMTDSFIEKNKDVLDPDGDGCLDVSGGYHDAGDHVKFGMPEGYSGAAVGWGYYEFRDAYEATGQDEHAETILRYFNDYFMKCTYLDNSGKAIAFCYQVGDGEIDHAYWNAPEVDEMFRRGWFTTEDVVGTDVTSIAAASLALNYMNFKDTDPEYAAQNLKYAQALFEYADTHEKGCNKDGPGRFYGSSKWEDDYCLAAVWLYMCTQDSDYMDKALAKVDYYAPSSYIYCWNDTWSGVICALAEADDLYGKKTTNSVGKESTEFIDKYVKLQNKSPYEDINWWSQIAKTVENWENGVTPKISPAGYAFLSEWGSARYNTAAQLVALVYDKHHGDKPSGYSEWAKGQMDYLLGDNPLNRCYVVGYSDISAKYPHHRAASGLSKCEDPGKQKYVLYGALVGGPDLKDEHNDLTSDWTYNEVTIDYNAAFVGACAGHYHFFGDSSMKVTPDFPPAVPIDGDNPDDPGGTTPTSKYWVEAFCVDVKQDDGPKATEVGFFVKSNVSKPSKNISVRYYFDTTGMSAIDPDHTELRQLYDQTAAETDYKAELSSFKQYKDNIYYVEVSWDGYVIAGSNKKYQFALGTYSWGNSWNPDDDWSHQDLVQFDDAFKATPQKCEYICVYDNGVLVGGTEPDGSVPQSSVTTTQPQETTAATTTTKQTTTTTAQQTTTTDPVKTTTTTQQTVPPDVLYGDLDLNGEVEMTDMTLLSQKLLGDIKFTAQQEKLADVNDDGSVNLADLSHFKQYMLKEKVILGPQK